MTPKKFIWTLLLLIAGIAQVQGQSRISWQRPFGGSVDDQVGDYNNYNDGPDHCLIRTLDGGYIFAGYSSSSNGDLTFNHGGDDFWVVKFGPGGTVQWQKSYGGSGSDQATSIVQTPDHGYVIAGFSDSNNGDISGNRGGSDFIALKIDSVGNIEWQKTFGGSAADRAYSIANAPGGGFVLAGVTYSNDSDITGQMGNADYWVVRTDSSGQMQWQKTLGGSSYDWANGIRVTNDGAYILSGWSQSNDSDVTNNHGSLDYWIVKLDDNATIQWQHTYGGSARDWGQHIIQTRDGGFAAVGYAESTDGDVTSMHGTWDYWLIRLDSSGTLLWQKTYGGTQLDEAYDLIETRDSGFAIVGASSSSDGDVTQNYGSADVWFVKTDSSGNLKWETSLGGSVGDWGLSLLQNPDRSYLLMGSTSSNNVDVIGNHGGWDVWVVQLAAEINVISGTVFNDDNGNAVRDSGETGKPNVWITEVTTGRKGLTNPDGKYLLGVLDSGTYVVSATAPLYHIVSPASDTAHFAGFAQTDSLHDFALTSIPGIPDLTVAMTAMPRFSPGFAGNYSIHYLNRGTTTQAATIILVPDSMLLYQSASPSPSNITADSIFWNILLAPGQYGNINVSMQVPVTTPLGTTLLSSCIILPILNDSMFEDNAALASVIVTGSYDPNDKSVSDTVVLTTTLPDPEFLDYVVRFQNTGTDTAFSVYILDTLSSRLDLNSFEWISSSHPVALEFLNDDRAIVFRFNNILLPDSNTNEPLSHGYVRYRMKPLTTLAAGTVIENTADIFFDFNAPVRTPTVNTLIALPSGVQSVLQNKDGILIYPNPSKDFFTVLVKNTGESFSVMIRDLAGRTVESLQEVRSGVQIGNALGAGMYTMEILSGKVKRTIKIVKTH